jgi:hypothetical protein
MDPHYAPHATFMAHDGHQDAMPAAPTSNSTTVYTGQPLSHVAPTAVPEPSALALMLTVGIVAIALSLLRVLRVRGPYRRDRMEEFGRS